MPVSIREVAAHAGVSLGTVSKVLNDSVGSQIASDTRERVRYSAKALGYHPSAVARALVRKQMDTIGVILPPGQSSPIRAPFFAAVFDGVLQAAAAHRQNVTLFTGHPWQDAAHSLRVYRDGRCDGLIAFFQPHESDILSSLVEANMPLVLMNDVREDTRITCVDVDNVLGAFEMTQYLLDLGHRRIALLCGYPYLNYVPTRREGYLQALTAAGISPDPRWVIDDQKGTLDEQVELLLSLPDDARPTAFFCFDDGIASHALQILARRGIRVPEEFSVAGFNDDSAADRQHPPLTTVHQPYEMLGERAVTLLLQQIENIDLRGTREFIPAKLVRRDSTAAPPVHDRRHL